MQASSDRRLRTSKTRPRAPSISFEPTTPGLARRSSRRRPTSRQGPRSIPARQDPGGPRAQPGRPGQVGGRPAGAAGGAEGRRWVGRRPGGPHDDGCIRRQAVIEIARSRRARWDRRCGSRWQARPTRDRRPTLGRGPRGVLGGRGRALVLPVRQQPRPAQCDGGQRSVVAGFDAPRSLLGDGRTSHPHDPGPIRPSGPGRPCRLGHPGLSSAAAHVISQGRPTRDPMARGPWLRREAQLSGSRSMRRSILVASARA